MHSLDLAARTDYYSDDRRRVRPGTELHTQPPIREVHGDHLGSGRQDTKQFGCEGVAGNLKDARTITIGSECGGWT